MSNIAVLPPISPAPALQSIHSALHFLFPDSHHKDQKNKTKQKTCPKTQLGLLCLSIPLFPFQRTFSFSFSLAAMVLLILRSVYTGRTQQCPDSLPASITDSIPLNIAKLDSYPPNYVSHWGSMTESSKKTTSVNKSPDKES